MIRDQILYEVKALASLVGAREPVVQFHEGIPALEGKKLRRIKRCPALF